MKKKIFSIVWLCLIFIMIDQTLKLIVITRYSAEINYGIFGIKLVKNTGIAFSLNSGNVKNIILETIVLIIVLRFWIKQINQLNKLSVVSLCMIISGGTSNLIDRIFRKRCN